MNNEGMSGTFTFLLLFIIIIIGLSSLLLLNWTPQNCLSSPSSLGQRLSSSIWSLAITAEGVISVRPDDTHPSFSTYNTGLSFSFSPPHFKVEYSTLVQSGKLLPLSLLLGHSDCHPAKPLTHACETSSPRFLLVSFGKIMCSGVCRETLLLAAIHNTWPVL